MLGQREGFQAFDAEPGLFSRKEPVNIYSDRMRMFLSPYLKQCWLVLHINILLIEARKCVHIVTF